MLRIGIVAGEASGDLLGSGLIHAIRTRVPDAMFEGIAGPGMQAEGCNSLYPMERLSVMGLFEALGRLAELIPQRRRLAQRYLTHPPDLFIGIDAPDYNLALECRLKAAGIPTVHYVSPSVWAWRQYRVRKISRSTDLILTLFPFEADFYRQHNVPVEFVGHPLAEIIPLESNRQTARDELGLSREGEVVALLPGSRSSEVRRLAPVMARAANWLIERRPGLRFVCPIINSALKEMFQLALDEEGNPPVELVAGQGRKVMAAADVVLLASGTAALEALLLKRPMVVTYRLHRLTAAIIRPFMATKRYSLPNLLAGRDLVPELVQEDATPEKMGAAVLSYLEQPALVEELCAEARRLHEQLRRNANERATDAVLGLIGK
ncbi:MAG: lipid-A-disaccharide synthase [Gammaproteobacteria bacterium]|nr:lipid-A-disaccharide synthase [Gammaproteobacteria bacterium]